MFGYKHGDGLNVMFGSKHDDGQRHANIYIYIYVAAKMNQSKQVWDKTQALRSSRKTSESAVYNVERRCSHSAPESVHALPGRAASTRKIS